ncbi:MAG: hypothetical protein NZ556_04325 [Fimbriimonadales bacterium]|nr:hypothetical protein [Fimbriimonadales bacterium]
MRRCPYCNATLPTDVPEQECPVCKNIVRPPNPHARRFAWVALITATLYLIAMFSMLGGDTGAWVFAIFGIATLSGVYLIITMYHFFKAG